MPAGYDEWAALHFRKDAAAAHGRTGDPDSDGLENAVEFALGADPRTGSATPLVAGRRTFQGQLKEESPPDGVPQTPPSASETRNGHTPDRRGSNFFRNRPDLGAGIS